MDSLIFQELEPEERVRMIDNNCDKIIENHKYTRKLTPEELDNEREKLSDAAIQINDIELELDAIKAQFKERMKPFTSMKYSHGVFQT